MEKRNNLCRWIVGIFLILYIFGMLLFNILNPSKEFSESENRKLEQKPQFSLNSLLEGKFTKNYEKYISDQFFLRDFWIGVKSSGERLMGKKENNEVYLGKDGYLFQKFNKPEKNKIQDIIEAINLFSSLNTEVNKYLMVVPNSTKVLEEKLPSFACDEDQIMYINKLKKYIKKDVKFVDVYNELLSKKDEYIFYKTDHHWTTKGAYYAYKKLIKDMGFIPHKEEYFNVKNVTNSFYGSLYSKSGFRNIEPDSIQIYTPKINENSKVWYYDKMRDGNKDKTVDKSKEYDTIYKIENINKKDKYTIFFNGNHSLVKINSDTKTNKKLLVVKDSYANCLIPFLTGHYDEVYVVDLRYYSENLQKLIKSNRINDVLILYNAKSFFEDDSINNICE